MKRLLVLLLLAGGMTLACVRSGAGPGAAPTPLASATLVPPSATNTPRPTATRTPNPVTQLAHGQQALFYGDWDTALIEYQASYDQAANDGLRATALLGLARTRWLQGNIYETERLIEDLLARFPLSPERAGAYYLLAQVRSQQDRYAEAADAYTQYLEVRPGRIDAYILDLRGDALQAGGDYAAAAKDFEAALLSGSMLDQDFLKMKMARAYALSGDTPTALTLYDDLYAQASDDNTRALIDLRRGEILLAEGQTERAHTAYLDAVNNYPTSPYAYTALVALVDAGVDVDMLQRGIVDYYAGQYGVAQSALNSYLQAQPADAPTAHYFYGLSAAAGGDYTTALERWELVIAAAPEHAYWARAWEQKAHTQWFELDDYPAAITTLLDFVKAAPNHPRAAEFLNDAAIVAERSGDLTQAADIWERLVRSYSASEFTARALFLSGITRYRLADYPYALDAFQRYVNAAPGIYEQAAGQLWIGKCYLKLDNPSAARAALEKAADADPSAYYSERANDLLFNRPPFDPPLSYSLDYDLAAERGRAEVWLRQRFNLAPETDLSSPGPLAAEGAFQRGDELWQLGEYNLARAEFEALRQTVQNDPANSYRLANYLLEQGAYRPAIMAARQVLTLAGMDDAATLEAPIYFNHIRFGLYYRELLLPLAQEYGLHPLMVYSVVRQESLFEGFVRSSAGASGLMQIMPATGQEIVQSLGWPPNYTSADLGRPIVNLALGVNYLDKQISYLDGDLYAALAGYNAGPGNAATWRELAPDDQDLYLEVIRYAETRDYIRRIYEIFAIYRRLYESTP